MKFGCVAMFIKEKRVGESLSQEELSKLLGYKNGQFISNVERGLCTIPLTKVRPLGKALNVNPEDICKVLIQDYSSHVRGVINEGSQL